MGAAIQSCIAEVRRNVGKAGSHAFQVRTRVHKCLQMIHEADSTNIVRTIVICEPAYSLYVRIYITCNVRVRVCS